jgi:acyl-CoA dehydrogenase
VRIHERRGDARRLVLSRLVLDHRLTPGDPLAPQDSRFEADAAARLLDDRPVPLEEAAALVAR